MQFDPLWVKERKQTPACNFGHFCSVLLEIQDFDVSWVQFRCHHSWYIWVISCDDCYLPLCFYRVLWKRAQIIKKKYQLTAKFMKNVNWAQLFIDNVKDQSEETNARFINVAIGDIEAQIFQNSTRYSGINVLFKVKMAFISLIQWLLLMWLSAIP
jgi:hypothetical protein